MSSKKNSGIWRWFPVIVGLMAGLLLTLFLWSHTQNRLKHDTDRGFAQRVEHAKLAIDRVNTEIFSQLGSIRAMASTNTLTEKSLYESITPQSRRHFSAGLQFFGYLEVGSSDNAYCIAFAVQPICLVADVIYPQATNQAVQANDMLASTSRRDAVARAVETGYVAITAPLKYAADNVAEPGLLAFLPVYIAGAPLDSIVARRQSLKGVVVASYSLEFLAHAELGANYLMRTGLQIRDNGLAGLSNKTYSRNRFNTLMASEALIRRPTDTTYNTTLVREVEQQVGGRKWAITYSDVTESTSPWTLSPSGMVALLGSLVSGLLALFIYSNVGARARAEDLARRRTASLRAREAQLYQALKATRMGSWQWDAATGQFWFDSFAGALIKPTNGKLSNLLEVIDRRDRKRVKEALLHAVSERKPWLIECRLAKRIGKVLWVELSAQISLDRHKKIHSASGLVRDISERIELTAARRRLVHKLINAEEKERRNIARELHDQLGQEITAIILGLKNLEGLPAKSERYSDLLEKLRRIVHDIDSRIDKFMLDLRPVVLDDLGLGPALQTQFEQWTDIHRIPVDAHLNGLDGLDLPFDIATTAYRVVQESLTNVAKHAQASSVDVIVEYKSNTLRIVVEDNGTGANGAKSAHSHGLAGIQERVESLGGEFRCESSPGNGFSVFATLPASTNLPAAATSEASTA